MNFLETIIDNLLLTKSKTVMTEIVDGKKKSINGTEMYKTIAKIQSWLTKSGVSKNDVIVLDLQNSIYLIALDLALLSMGVTSVHLYTRQSFQEKSHIIQKLVPKFLIVENEKTARDKDIIKLANNKLLTLESLNNYDKSNHNELVYIDFDKEDLATIIFSSGTTSTPKGIMLTKNNFNFMIKNLSEKSFNMIGSFKPQKKYEVFQYLPLCFCASRLFLYAILYKGQHITLCSDLKNLRRDLKISAPDFYLNVPLALVRMKDQVESKIYKISLLAYLYKLSCSVFTRVNESRATIIDSFVYKTVAKSIFYLIKISIGKNLKLLLCGSAYLSPDIQKWFYMLGINVYQVYGLTETTGVITFDWGDSNYRPKFGTVGKTIEGIEITISKDNELLVKGPNLFKGYWGEPDLTKKSFENEWFKTGDVVDFDTDKNIIIKGRITDVIVMENGHKVSPEAIEKEVASLVDGITNVILVGDRKPFLSIIITGKVSEQLFIDKLEKINSKLSHYQRIKKVHFSSEEFTVDNGLLTSNLKLKRKKILEKYHSIIENLYGS